MDTTETEVLLENLLRPYASAVKRRIHADGSPRIEMIDIYPDPADNSIQATIPLVECIQVHVVIKDNEFSLYIVEEDYTVRGTRRDPGEIDLLEKTFTLGDPNSINEFHKTLKGFIKEHYGKLADELTQKAEDHRVLIKEIIDETHQRETIQRQPELVLRINP